MVKIIRCTEIARELNFSCGITEQCNVERTKTEFSRR